MPANGLRVNHYDFVALHSMWDWVPSRHDRSLIYMSIVLYIFVLCLYINCADSV